MNAKVFRNYLLAAPAALGATLFVSGGAALAEEQVTVAELSSGDSMAQVTSVSQLSDVQPTDWAFQALQSLVERYGCIAGYPDGTYRGNRAMTRYEFAAGLNACLDRINELIAAGTADLATKEDLATLQRLQEEFAAELATLRGRVDALEARTTELEENQFSTTTKLAGEVIFGVADTFGDAAEVDGAGNTIDDDTDDPTQTIFGYRARLNFETSFTGEDKLRTRLQARNITEFDADVTGTDMTRLSYDGDSDNTFEIGELWYRFPIGDQLTVQVDAVNIEFWDALIDPLSPLESSGSGAVSRFGRFNPLFRNDNEGAGLTAEYEFNDQFRVQIGYAAESDSNDPGEGNGIFNGGFSAIANLIFSPNEDIDLGVAYEFSNYPFDDVNVADTTGTEFAQDPFEDDTRVNAAGFQFQWRVSQNIGVHGWFGIDFLDQVDRDNDATAINAALGLTFPDVGKEGSLGAIVVGIPPTVTENDIDDREDEDIPIHVEALYRYPINDNIAITPGVFVLINPEGNSDNDTQVVGTIRTTFKF